MTLVFFEAASSKSVPGIGPEAGGHEKKHQEMNATLFLIIRVNRVVVKKSGSVFFIAMH